MIVELGMAAALALAGQDPKAVADPMRAEQARVAYTDINDVPPAVREPTEAEYAEFERLVVKAETARDAERFDEAIEAATAVAALSTATFGPRHPITASCLNIIGQVKYDRGDYDDAEAIFRDGLVIRREALGEVHPDVAESLNNIAGVVSRRGDYDQSLGLLQQAVAIWGQVGTFDRNLADGLANLAQQNVYMGRYAEAEDPARRAVALTEKVYDPDDPETAGNYGVLGDVLVSLGRYQEGEIYLMRANAIYASQASHTLKAGLSLFRLGQMRRLQGKHAEAADLFRRSTEVFAAAVGPDHAFTGAALAETGAALMRDDQVERAEGLLRRALKVQERAQGLHHIDVASIRVILAEALLKQGYLEQADAQVRRSIADFEAADAGGERSAAAAHLVYATILQAQGRGDDAVAEARKAVASLEGLLTSDHPEVTFARSRLADVLIANESTAEARMLLNDSLALSTRSFGAQTDDAIGLRAQLGRLVLQEGDAREGLELLRQTGVEPGDVRLTGVSVRRMRELLRLKVRAAWMQAAPST